MTTPQVNKYRVWCDTSGVFKETWGETEPTMCPLDPLGHTIDPEKTSIMEVFKKNVVKVQEEDIPTNEEFFTETLVITASGMGVTETTVSWPMPISVLEVQYTNTADQEGDELELSVAPHTIIGAITSDVSGGDTIINVNQTVIDNVKTGRYIDLFNIPATTNDLGRVTAIDKVNNHITLETPASQNFSAASPTYVRMTAKMVRNYTFGPSQKYVVGEGKIGGTYLPANTPVYVKYTNNHNDISTLTVIIEALS